MLNIIDEIKEEGKTALILDPSEAANVFFKYKGNLIDMEEFFIKESIGK